MYVYGKYVVQCCYHRCQLDVGELLVSGVNCHLMQDSSPQSMDSQPSQMQAFLNQMTPPGEHCCWLKFSPVPQWWQGSFQNRWGKNGCTLVVLLYCQLVGTLYSLAGPH